MYASLVGVETGEVKFFPNFFAARSSPFPSSPLPETDARKTRAGAGEGGGGDLGARINLEGLRTRDSHRRLVVPRAAALLVRRLRPAAGDVCRRRWPVCSATRSADRWWCPAAAPCSIASDLGVPLRHAASFSVPVACICLLRWWWALVVYLGSGRNLGRPVWPTRWRRRPRVPLSFMEVQLRSQTTHPDPLPGWKPSIILFGFGGSGTVRVVTFLEVSSGALWISWECRGTADGGDGTSGSRWCSWRRSGVASGTSRMAGLSGH